MVGLNRRLIDTVHNGGVDVRVSRLGKQDAIDRATQMERGGGASAEHPAALEDHINIVRAPTNRSHSGTQSH